MVILKHVPMPDASYASTAPTRMVLKVPSLVAPTKYLATRLAAHTTVYVSSVARFDLSNIFMK